MSSPPAGVVPASAPSRRQKRMGPAPFASFEDLSDELESPDDKNAAGSVVRLPGIREDATPNTPAHQEFLYAGISLVGAPSTTPPSTTVSSLSHTSTRMSLQTPSTPRIDISRASSSSHHDSRDSTPERELFDGQGQNGAKLGLAFKEEGTLDLRSSTEELDFHEPQDKLKVKKRPSSPSAHEDPLYQRKDSQSSEIGLLSISGRTSRLSSIGSQGSTHSRVSNVSHLSIISGQSERSPSPHKMLLETSFCGNKTPVLASHSQHAGTKIDADMLEKVLLARKHDPREAILAEGCAVPKEKAVKKQYVRSEITIKVDKPSSDGDSAEKSSKLPGKYVSPSGVEYTYIPLKGPLPKETTSSVTKTKLRETKSFPNSNTMRESGGNRPKSTSPSVPKSNMGEAPKYIRIKLKPDHMYEDEPTAVVVASNSLDEVKKPACLNLNDTANKKPFQSFTQVVSEAPPATKKQSPKLPSRHTPSPSLSRRSSFTSLFKSKETIVSPESPTGLKRKNTLTGILRDTGDTITRSRSKSRERDKSSVSTAPSSTESIDSKGGKQKSVLSIFKTKKTKKLEASSPEVLSSLDGIANVEFKFNAPMSKKYYEPPLQGESIRIPLHSPTHYENRGILQEVKSSSQESQETVIDTTKYVDADIEAVSEKAAKRPSSTSSENVVFSTKLGSSNDLFTTKLPKEKQNDDSISGVPKSNSSSSSKELVNGMEQPLTQITRTIEETTTAIIKTQPECTKSIRNSIMSTLANEDRNSSESEKDSELEYLKNKPEEKPETIEPERKGFVYQQDSYDDELPYVPTTLPLERSVGVPIVPIKQRGTFEMKTYPIERPRSTTPINLSTLEDYCEDVVGSINTENITKAIEKLKISLPRDESTDRVKVKSPRRPGANTNWFAFSDAQKEEAEPPPLPPKGVQKEWINFEEIPERRKPPRRIQTIPSRSNIEVPESVLQENVVYNYVNPEDCKCECHEIARERELIVVQQPRVQEDEMPLLDEEPGEEEKSAQDMVDRIKVDVAMSDRRSVISDSSIDLSTSLEHPEALPSLRTPFNCDLGISSNRSSIVSQDEQQSPDSTPTPNAFPKL